MGANGALGAPRSSTLALDEKKGNLKMKLRYLSLLVLCVVACRQAALAQTGTPTPAIEVPARVKLDMEAAFKEGKNYFIWLVKDTKKYVATREGMPFPHALIECYCVANAKLQNPKFKTTIEVIAAKSGGSTSEQRLRYAEADLQKDATWWGAAQKGTPVGILFAYVPQGERLVGVGRAKLYLISHADTGSHEPVSNTLSVDLEVPE